MTAAPARVIALVPAGGSGERFGGGVAKQFLPVAGRSLLAWTLSRLIAAGLEEIVVALPPGSTLPEDASFAGAVRAVPGGATRQDSVANCVAGAPGAPGDLLLVHDGARAAVDPEDVRATIAAALAAGGAVLGRPVSDTVKRISDGLVVATVERSELFRAETPQVFRRSLFEQALELARRERFVGTDEAALVERLPGATVRAVLARHPNPKLTEPADLPVVEALLRRAAP